MEELALLSRSWPEPRRTEEQPGLGLSLGTGGEARAATAAWNQGSSLAEGGVGWAGREGQPRENPWGDPRIHHHRIRPRWHLLRRPCWHASIVTKHIRCTPLTQAKLTDEVWALYDL